MYLKDPAFEIPPTIKPDDLDWEQSRPLKPWIVRRGSHPLPGSWNLYWIELSRTDIASVLCAPTKRGDAEHLTSGTKQRTAKGRPNFERAKRAVDELYPDGPPEQAALPNMQLLAQVGQKLKNQRLPSVSNDTILRAAGRRRK